MCLCEEKKKEINEKKCIQGERLKKKSTYSVLVERSISHLFKIDRTLLFKLLSSLLLLIFRKHMQHKFSSSIQDESC